MNVTQAIRAHWDSIAFPVPDQPKPVEIHEGPWVYIAGPISRGDHCRNMRMAAEASHALIQAGCLPFAPQAQALLLACYGNATQHEWDEWMAMDFAIIRRCAGLLRLPGLSKGADLEVAFAQDERIPTVLAGERPIQEVVQELIDELARENPSR